MCNSTYNLNSNKISDELSSFLSFHCFLGSHSSAAREKKKETRPCVEEIYCPEFRTARNLATACWESSAEQKRTGGMRGAAHAGPAAVAAPQPPAQRASGKKAKEEMN